MAREKIEIAAIAGEAMDAYHDPSVRRIAPFAVDDAVKALPAETEKLRLTHAGLLYRRRHAHCVLVGPVHSPREH